MSSRFAAVESTDRRATAGLQAAPHASKGQENGRAKGASASFREAHEHRAHSVHLVIDALGNAAAHGACMTMNSTLELLTPTDVALSLGLRPKTLANWRTALQGPPFLKIGTRVLYERTKLEAWAHAQEVSTYPTVKRAR